MGHCLQPVVYLDLLVQVVFLHLLVQVVDYCLQPVVVLDLLVQVVVLDLLVQVVFLDRQVVVLDLLVQVDIQVQLGCLHNLLDLVDLQEVLLRQVGYLHHQEVGYNPLLQEEVLDLLVRHFEDIQVHKDYHYNLGLVLFHLEAEEVLLVNMKDHLDFHHNSFLQTR